MTKNPKKSLFAFFPKTQKYLFVSSVQSPWKNWRSGKGRCSLNKVLQLRYSLRKGSENTSTGHWAEHSNHTASGRCNSDFWFCYKETKHTCSWFCDKRCGTDDQLVNERNYLCWSLYEVLRLLTQAFSWLENDEYTSPAPLPSSGEHVLKLSSTARTGLDSPQTTNLGVSFGILLILSFFVTF